MHSIKEIYRTGTGPSSSHTMGPRTAAEQFLNMAPEAHSYRVSLFSSLALTGKGHFTDMALNDVFSPEKLEIIWKPDESLPFHPNGMLFEAIDKAGGQIAQWEVYSIGGGAIAVGPGDRKEQNVYPHCSMNEIIEDCDRTGHAIWEYAETYEGAGLWDFLARVWKTMQEAIRRGLETEGVLPGGLGLSRKAWAFHRKAKLAGDHFKRGSILAAYALAVSEENASGGIVVTAPTCGSCGVLPATLKYLQEMTGCSDNSLYKALATAGIIGILIKHNASISGAEVGCQGEVGSACAMAAGAAAQLLGGTVRQVEYAAEMGLEHHLGLTCDPVDGLVQIPCIERNAFAAKRALDCADYSIFSGGVHRISFDEVVSAMKQTGHDIPPLYRETSTGGLAAVYKSRKK